MLIDHFSTFPHGGAGTAARRLHERLIERGVRSRFNYWKDQTAQRLDASYRQVEFAQRTAKPWLAPITRKLQRRRSRTVCNRYDRHVADRPENFELFTIPWTIEPTHLDWTAFQSDIVHLHWMAFFIDYPSFFASVPRQIPIVWSFHDMNPLTGGCHYSSGCSRFTVGCGQCPQISQSGPSDVSRFGFRDKSRALRDRTIHILTPNRWLSELAQHSVMFPKRTQYHVIPLGLDETVFRPVERKRARDALGLHSEGVMLAFGAEDIGNYRKGFHHLMAALQRVTQQTDIECLVFGSGKVPTDVRGLPRMHEFGFIDDERKQALLYSAADMFVLPSREDNQPQTGLEAMACGTPVIAFRAGGIPEYVLPGETGLLAELGDEQEMAQHILALAQNEELRIKLSQNARELIKARFTADRQAKAYIGLYHQIASTSRPLDHRAAA